MRVLGVAGGAELRAFCRCNSPGHPRRVVRKAERAVGSQKNNAAVAAETVKEVVDGFGGGLLRRGALSDAIDGPLAQYKLHDGLAPARQRYGRGIVVRI